MIGGWNGEARTAAMAWCPSNRCPRGRFPGRRFARASPGARLPGSRAALPAIVPLTSSRSVTSGEQDPKLYGSGGFGQRQVFLKTRSCHLVTSLSLQTISPGTMDDLSSIHSTESTVDAAMSDLVEPEPLAASQHSRLELFMTVVRVTDWSTIVPWYIDTLGMVPVLIDAEHEFALLSAGDGRLGFKGLKSNCTVHERTKVRFVFQVADVDLERKRLIEQGVVVSAPFDNREEGFREIRLHDPGGQQPDDVRLDRSRPRRTVFARAVLKNGWQPARVNQANSGGPHLDVTTTDEIRARRHDAICGYL